MSKLIKEMAKNLMHYKIMIDKNECSWIWHVSPMASIRFYCKYFDDNKLYLVALMYLLQVW
jgi:hypothetical protein